MKVILLIASALLFACTSGGGNKGYNPGKSRLRVERPGMGIQLDNDLARLLIDGKRMQAMSKCNEVLFSSRSKQDREIANYWRTVLMALEEIDEGNYDKAHVVIKDGQKWWKSDSREYHGRLIMQLLMTVHEVSRQVAKSQSLVEKERQAGKNQRDLEVQELQKKLEEIEKRNKKLEKLLRDLEGIQ